MLCNSEYHKDDPVQTPVISRGLEGDSEPNPGEKFGSKETAWIRADNAGAPKLWPTAESKIRRDKTSWVQPDNWGGTKLQAKPEWKLERNGIVWIMPQVWGKRERTTGGKEIVKSSKMIDTDQLVYNIMTQKFRW